MPPGESLPHPIEIIICVAEKFAFDNFSIHFAFAANFGPPPLPTALYAIDVFGPLPPADGLSVAYQSWCSNELPLGALVAHTEQCNGGLRIDFALGERI